MFKPSSSRAGDSFFLFLFQKNVTVNSVTPPPPAPQQSIPKASTKQVRKSNKNPENSNSNSERKRKKVPNALHGTSRTRHHVTWPSPIISVREGARARVPQARRYNQSINATSRVCVHDPWQYLASNVTYIECGAVVHDTRYTIPGPGTRTYLGT